MRSTIVQAGCPVVCGLVLTLALDSTLRAQIADDTVVRVGPSTVARPVWVPEPGDSDADDPFARRGWHLELGGHGALETWNYNGSHEEMYGPRAGLTYGLGNGIAFIAGWPLYYVSQRGVDGYLFGATFGLRGRVYRRGRMSAFLEFELGISESDTAVPPRGTRFNYLVLGGAGATVRLRSGLHLLSGLKWVHVSNNGLAGRDRNPDIEAVGPHAAVLIRF